MSAIVSNVKHKTSPTVDFGGNAWDTPVPSARRTPIYAEENATVSTELITPYNRADFTKHNVVKGIINDKRKRPRR